MNTLGNEYYWLLDHVWKKAKGKSFLCIACIEKRLRRKLTPGDFDFIREDAIEVNSTPWVPRSKRLKARMGLPDNVETCTARPLINLSDNGQGGTKVEIDFGTGTAKVTRPRSKPKQKGRIRKRK